MMKFSCGHSCPPENTPNGKHMAVFRKQILLYRKERSMDCTTNVAFIADISYLCDILQVKHLHDISPVKNHDI